MTEDIILRWRDIRADKDFLFPNSSCTHGDSNANVRSRRVQHFGSEGKLTQQAIRSNADMDFSGATSAPARCGLGRSRGKLCRLLQRTSNGQSVQGEGR